MAKRRKRSRAAEDAEEPAETQERLPPVTRKSDDPPEKKFKWINKQRVMIFASRGITFRDRHLMLNLRTLLPHSKPVHTMEELKMTGNCLKGSRPLLSFDKAFNETPFSRLMKELLSQVFGTPRYHPKSQPFVDHVFTFSLLDHRIWFRNYQIVEESGALVEIGPRFVLNPIKVFEGSFGGAVIYSNPNYVTPSAHRRSLKAAAAGKYKERKEAKANLKHRIAEGPAPSNPLDDIFQTVPPEKAKGRDKLLFRRKK
ncbi:hypothetical protein V5799_004952 [Amblyomma americanum]|uniref:Ribosome biogenesis protein BRX1 homolog n=1 Tax=Amblyomma americanum TaxID=6943 RepID=A0AAQ4D4M7_AMBAM